MHIIIISNNAVVLQYFTFKILTNIQKKSFPVLRYSIEWFFKYFIKYYRPTFLLLIPHFKNLSPNTKTLLLLKIAKVPMARESQGWLWTNLWLFWSLLQVYHFDGSPTPKSASLIHFYLPQHNCYASAFIVIDNHCT